MVGLILFVSVRRCLSYDESGCKFGNTLVHLNHDELLHKC